jgi:GTP:adenosylcobinamide-phosphate guanylyltransferase
LFIFPDHRKASRRTPNVRHLLSKTKKKTKIKIAEKKQELVQKTERGYEKELQEKCKRHEVLYH